MVAWTSRSDSWNETGASHVPRHVLRQASRTAVKDNQGRRDHVLPRRHGHDRTTGWPDSPRGSLTAPLAASGVLPIWPLPLWAFGISRCQSACSSPTAHGSSCTCVAESITHATYNRPESVPGPHSVRQCVYEKNGPKLTSSHLYGKGKYKERAAGKLSDGRARCACCTPLRRGL